VLEVRLEQGVGVPVQLVEDQEHPYWLSQEVEEERVEQATGVPVHKPVLEL
jgi:hypothetical protein